MDEAEQEVMMVRGRAGDVDGRGRAGEGDDTMPKREVMMVRGRAGGNDTRPRG